MESREIIKSLIMQANTKEEAEVLATMYALMGYVEYVREINLELHERALEFSLETADVPGVMFRKEK